MGVENETPSLVETIENAIESRLADLHVSMPAELVSYDPSTQKAKVQPLLKRKFSGQTPVDLPPIEDVPVVFPRGKDCIISLPIKKGDTGMIIFQERSIDVWLSKGGRVDPNDPRKHDLSDAVFVPGLYPFSQPSDAEADNILIKNKDSIIRIKPDGKFQIMNTANELLDLIVQVMGKMITEMTEQGEVDTTNTIFGAMKPNNFANYTQLKLDYQQLKTKLETLKG